MTRPRSSTTKRSRSLVLLGVVSVILTLIATVPAEAEISPQAETTWGVYGLATGTQSDAIESLVFAVEQVGDRVFVGGKFLEARPDADGTPVAQPFLAAFDADSGALIPSFTPVLDGAVYSLQASPDGSRLFVGGEFRTIDGDDQARGLAAIDPTTGAVDTSWRAKVRNASGARGLINSMTISGDQLYVAGRFDLIGGGNQPLHITEKVARVALVDGTVDMTLSTDIDGSSVWGIAVAPDASKIYLAGYHDTVDGNPAGADYAVLNASDGRLIPGLSDKGGNSPNTNRWYGQDIVAVGDLVFWAGSEHTMRVFRADTGELVTQHSTDRGGDFQDLEVVGDRVYGSCHCYTNHFADFDYWTRGDAIPADVLVTPIKYVAAYSAVTGEYLPSFSLDASAVKAGVWAIHGDDDGCLWVGGDLSRVTTLAGNDRAAGGFARFCSADGTDTSAPTAPGNLTQTRAEDHKVVVRWDSSTDNVGVESYEVSRDGNVVGTKAASSAGRYWFTDAGLDAGTTYAYSVVAVDAAGNRSVAATLSATTTGQVEEPGPDAPTGLRSTLQTRERIVLNWNAAPGAVSYIVQRDAGAGFIDIATQTGRWFTNHDLSAATSYSYQVIAVDGDGVSSAPSSVIVVSTLP